MRERAEEWLEFADVDLRAAEKLGDDEYLSRATAFHAHQCAEKSIKNRESVSLLRHRGV